MIFPINEIVNSERILSSNCYQFDNKAHKEDIWLFKYLLCEGKTPEEIFKIWKTLQSSVGREVGNKDRVFNDLLENASKIKKLHFQFNFQIYQEEIDYINKQKCSKWIKEWALLILGYFKARNQQNKKIRIESAYSKAFLMATSLERKRSYVSLDIMESCGFLKSSFIRDEKKPIYFEDDWEDKEQFWELTFPVFKEPSSILKTNTLADVPSLFGLLKNQKVCAHCGKFFDINSKTKTNLCPECYKKDLRQRKTETMRKLRACGKESAKTL